MAITVLNNKIKEKRAASTYKTFEELKKAATFVKEKEALPAPVSKQEVSTSFNEKPSTINNGIIKPKYIQDSSVVYKKSGYIRDLLGEGN